MTERPLFDHAFLEALESLRMAVRAVPAGGSAAEHRSRSRGPGIEFADMRPYVAGDDVRAIDWHLFQRLDRVFVRLYLHEEDLPVHFLLDESGSMTFAPGPDGNSKHRVARQTVAALAWVALSRMDRISVWPFRGESLDPLPNVGGRLGFERLLQWLTDRRAEGGSDLRAAVRRLASRRARRGLCVIVSDFFEPGGVDVVREALGLLPHRVCLVRPVHPGEERPAARGPLELVDCENETTLTLQVDDGVADRYARAYESFVAGLASAAAERGGSLCTVRTDQPVVPQIADIFERGAFEP